MVTSNKTKHVLAEKELNELSKKVKTIYYQQKIIVFSQVECILQAIMDVKIWFFYQPTPNTLGIGYFLSVKSKVM